MADDSTKEEREAVARVCEAAGLLGSGDLAAAIIRELRDSYARGEAEAWHQATQMVRGAGPIVPDGIGDGPHGGGR